MIDPSIMGVSVVSLIGSLGAAGAAVAITYFFLQFLRECGERNENVVRRFENMVVENREWVDQRFDMESTLRFELQVRLDQLEDALIEIKGKLEARATCSSLSAGISGPRVEQIYWHDLTADQRDRTMNSCLTFSHPDHGRFIVRGFKLVGQEEPK